jgi:hypothetical protein
VLSGRLFRAFIGHNPQRILDFRTGIGAWAIDVADDLISAVVVNTDLGFI